MVLVLCIGDLNIPYSSAEVPGKLKALLQPGKIHQILCTGNLCDQVCFGLSRFIWNSKEKTVFSLVP